jgi:hypothetical protein
VISFINKHDDLNYDYTILYISCQQYNGIIMSDPINLAAQGAVNSLKQAQQVGKQLAGVVSDQTADMEELSKRQVGKKPAARKSYANP